MKRKPDNRCASLLKLLADDTRLAVVRLLMKAPRYVGELNDAIAIEQNLLSHHLKVLREGGIAIAERQGRSILYRLSPEIQARRRAGVIDLGCCRVVFD